MSNWQQEYIDRYYRQLPGWKNLQVLWRELLGENIPRQGRVLEIGPGPSNDASEYLSSITSRLVGLDVDTAAKRNVWLDEAYVYDGQRFPFPDNHFDAVVSRWVNEHIEDPKAHCREVCRVLAPNGKYIFRTSNMYHYVALVARVTPQWFHVLVANRLRNYSSNHHDPYPTRYRLNTQRRVRTLLSESGLSVDTLEMRESYPIYGRSSRVLFFLFMAYERVVNSTTFLENIRYAIDCVARKNAEV